MANEKVKILAVSGSPRRKGNTATMMQYCLKAAEEMGNVETKFISLADYKLVPCIGCMRCFGWQAPADDPYKCYKFNDDTEVLAPMVAEYDGLIVGFPIYAAGVPSLFRCFMEKMHHYGPMSFTKHAGGLRFKAFGCISQGGRVYGGQETAMRMIYADAVGLGMYPVNAWPTVMDSEPQAGHTGGALSCVDGTAVYGERAWRKEGCRTVPPSMGSRNERTLKNLGRNMVTTALTLKLGRKALKETDFQEPENISFTKYSVKPRKGSYVARLMEEGKVQFISKEEIEARKTRVISQ
ncbi:MAG: flavodoxin family protein [Deltaproteobacteria bacterium]|nr:flavodoxin family protein [Deltaproteobacteria bacterium]